MPSSSTKCNERRKKNVRSDKQSVRKYCSYDILSKCERFPSIFVPENSDKKTFLEEKKRNMFLSEIERTFYFERSLM